jgi:predicted nuclease with TOPRIM domain
MADQFDLEQGIMGCWHVTDDLDILLEEIMENEHFTKDQTSNFVLGLSTIYQAKFEKLFRTFEQFLGEYYRMRNQVNELEAEVEALREEAYLVEEANIILSSGQAEIPEIVSLDQLFDEEEERLSLLDENDRLDFIEDEFSPT